MTNRLTRAAMRGIMTAGLIAGGAGAALAHHSAAIFDASTQKVLTGTVKKFDYSNPHTWVWIEVANDQGGTDLWGVEGMSPNYLNRRGWSRNTLKVGDKLTITVRPMKNGEKAGMWLRATRPDGEVLLMNGEIKDKD
ncbi:MAG TPA: DUF6152 family protein [Bryobacteraceae bacterium]|nr:DUF6152 family protein [Bryobacteraceae bacterium]